MAYSLDKRKQARSDDFVDGLQVAYKAVYKLSQAAVDKGARIALAKALQAIDDEINHVDNEEAPKIVVL